MNKIEITTPQNVTIEYQLASSIQRVVAQIIDSVAMGLSFTLLGWAWALAGLMDSDFGGLFYSLLIISVFIGYDMVMEIRNNGQTIGKMAMGIQVIRLDGEALTKTTSFGRWALKLVDVFLSWGILGLLFTISSDKTQRLGDMVSGTAVIRSSKKAGRMSLKHILDLQKTIDYEPKFPTVTQLSNEEMLLVKETSDRYKKHRNLAHEDALKLLAKKIETQLGIKGGKDKQLFFQTLIRDYVFLTR